ncbi:asparagine synthase (glutamine-hydrolyzing) [Algoriphagus sp.]|uniref:asparagine synthase (glutamine-hydrolyzing) n=1 Tax=Algoriphagus sp. TaxID=1872435 RepID=UPI00391C5E8A
MCGISVILSKDDLLIDSYLAKSEKLLHHRGPDSRGVWKDSGIGMVHTRLSIQDLTDAGHQPMISSSSKYVMVFNGEIYNHLQLRQKFFPGYCWRGHSDTETILELFELMGEKCFELMVGMWAIVIWDKEREKLLVSRDRYGQKPIYIRKNKTSLMISSEIKPLLVFEEKNKVNALMAAEYLALGNYGHLGEETFFRDIKQVLPGTYFWVDHNRQFGKIINYWNIPIVKLKDKIKVGTKDLEDLEDVIREAVVSQTIADVPLGASLSGGLDSSIIVGILASSATTLNPISVFTAQTPNSKFDESPFVNAVMEKWGGRLNLFKKDLGEVRISSKLERTLMIQEEPFGDPSIIAHGYLMDMAAELKIKVVLGGQGADELFRGYSHNIKQLFSHELRRMNFSYTFPEMNKSNLSLHENFRIIAGAIFPELERNLREKSRENRRHFISQELRQAASQTNNSFKLAMAYEWDEGIEESIKGVHIPHLVHYDDRNGMARSIEGRMPFLDHRILDLVSTFKPDSFFKNGLSKVLLREAGKKFLPEKVYKRTDKLGFFTPLQHILQDEIEFVSEILSDSPWVEKKMIQQDLEMIRSRKSNGNIAERVWRAMSLTLWAKIFNVEL